MSGEEQEAATSGGAEDGLLWVECYDPIMEETYYYCHKTKETTYDPPDDYITAMEDKTMRSVITIQCMGRKRMAAHKVQRARYHKYMDMAFHEDFCSGPVEILAGGMGVRKRELSANKAPTTAFVGTKTMSWGKHYFMFQISKLSDSDRDLELGLCTYIKPNRAVSALDGGKSIQDMPGSLVVTSNGDLYKAGVKTAATWMEPYGQGDTIGFVLNYDEHKISVSRNAMFLGDLSIAGMTRTDLVAAATLCEAGDEVTFQWCDKPPYEQFSTEVDSSNESIEAVLSKYQRKKKRSSIEDAGPPPVAWCRGVGEEHLEEARLLLEGLLHSHERKVQQGGQVRAKAVALKTKLEAEAKRKEVEERKAKAERKKALHRIPDSRERKESERRNRKKYMALQMERYAKARTRFLEAVEATKKEQAAYMASQVALKKEVLRIKKEKEEQRYAVLAGNVGSMFEACRYGMPVWRLQELVNEEVQRLESRSRNPVQVFDRFCGSVEVGYVLESSHPYSSDTINQCVEVVIEEGDASGVCIAFDPRSDTRAGDGHISFQVEGEGGGMQRQRQRESEGEEEAILAAGITSQLFRGRGLELNLSSTSMRTLETPPLGSLQPCTPPPSSHGGSEQGSDQGSVPSTADLPHVPLPGVGKNPPLYLPSRRFTIRFTANPYDSSAASGSWGWRLVAFGADSQEHGQSLMDRSVHNANILRVLNQRRDPRGDTALHIAAWEGNVPAISYLASEGADIHAIDSIRTKVTPLHLAARAGHLGAVRRLLELGGDVLCKTNIGDTPLHYGCRAGHIRVARRLVKAERKELVAVKTKNQRGHWAHEVVPRNHCGLLYEMMKDFFEGRRRKPRKRNRHVIGA